MEIRLFGGCRDLESSNRYRARGCGRALTQANASSTVSQATKGRSGPKISSCITLESGAQLVSTVKGSLRCPGLATPITALAVAPALVASNNHCCSRSKCRSLAMPVYSLLAAPSGYCWLRMAQAVVTNAPSRHGARARSRAPCRSARH